MGNKDEMDKQNVYLLTDAEEEEESIEGADPTTSPRPTIFDSILLDLDEKTKEMEKNEETQKKKGRRCKKRKKRAKKRKYKRKNKKQHKIADECMDRFNQTADDEKMLDAAICDKSKLNPWLLRQWEFNDQHRRRSLRTLLCSLNGDILWKSILNETKS